MKLIVKLASTLVLVTMLTGCASMLPKDVEFFQKKVQSVPVATPAAKEVQRQTSLLAVKRAEDTYIAAISNDAPAAVIEPAKDTVVLTEAVSTSLGPPLSPWRGEVTALAEKLNSDTAALNKRIDAYSATVQTEAGKKIEGTGLFQVNYFVYLGICGAGILLLLLLGSLAWGALKIYGIANPVVGVGTSAVSMGASEVAKALGQVISGGEAFKTAVEAKFGAGSDVAKTVLDLFTTEHQKSQDQSVQATIKTLTA